MLPENKKKKTYKKYEKNMILIKSLKSEKNGEKIELPFSPFI